MLCRLLARLICIRFCGFLSGLSEEDYAEPMSARTWSLMNHPLPRPHFFPFLPPGAQLLVTPPAPPRGLSSQPRFRPAWLCSFPF